LFNINTTDLCSSDTPHNLYVIIGQFDCHVAPVNLFGQGRGLGRTGVAYSRRAGLWLTADGQPSHNSA